MVVFFPPRPFEVKFRLCSCSCALDRWHVCRETLKWQPRATVGVAAATFFLLVLPSGGLGSLLAPVLTERLFSLLPRPLLVCRFPLFFSLRCPPGSDSPVRGRQPVHGDHPEAAEEPGHPHPVHDQGVQSLWDAGGHPSGIPIRSTITTTVYPPRHDVHCGSETPPSPPLPLFLQENRIGKAVEVMIQHVENLRRMYTKEHAELLELRETLMQNERSFGSHTERGEATSLILINTYQ